MSDAQLVASSNLATGIFLTMHTRVKESTDWEAFGKAPRCRTLISQRYNYSQNKEGVG